MPLPNKPRLSVLVAFAFLAASPAVWAFDISGHWTGTYKCTGNLQGAKNKYTETLDASITQSGSAVGASIVFNSGAPFLYSGFALGGPKPDNGDLMVDACTTDNNPESGLYDEIGRLTVKTKPAKGTGTLSGTSNYSGPSPPQIYTCKWKLKRISPTDPGVATTCP